MTSLRSGDATRVLFIGQLHSSHTLGWIDLLANDPRFQLAGVSIVDSSIHVPVQYPICTRDMLPPFAHEDIAEQLPAETHQRIHAALKINPFFVYYPVDQVFADVCTIAHTLRVFSPHIVHTFAFTPASIAYSFVPKSLT